MDTLAALRINAGCSCDPELNLVLLSLLTTQASSVSQWTLCLRHFQDLVKLKKSLSTDIHLKIDYLVAASISATIACITLLSFNTHDASLMETSELIYSHLKVSSNA